VDAIKIDRTFTQAIGTGSVVVSILPQILAMADALRLQVIVEGVETDGQATYFAASDRPMFAQGWLFGKPMPAPEFHGMLRQRAAGPVLAQVSAT
jgi:sensor c-di-GMP phosphodiesterase-like protein